MKTVFIKILDIVISIVCFCFVLSSFFCILSFSFIDELIYKDTYVLIVVFIIGIMISILLTRPLTRLWLIARLPVKDWKFPLLK